MRSSKKQAGFTLIELMIAVVVMGILVSIAVPAYNDQVRKTRRAQAKADIQEITQIMERFYTVNNTYVGYTIPAALANSPRDGTPLYAISLTAAATANAYTLQAVPSGDQVYDKCGNLGINQSGARTPTTAGCWN